MDIDIASKLFPNMTTLIIQLISTGILLIVFKKFLWVPVQEYFAKRADYIENQINEAKSMNEQAKVFVEESEIQAKESAKEYRDIIDRAKEDASKAKNQILEEARIEAQNKIALADKEIEAQKLLARDEMRQEIVDIAIEVATKVMQKDMNTTENQQFVEEFVDKVVN